MLFTVVESSDLNNGFYSIKGSHLSWLGLYMKHHKASELVIWSEGTRAVNKFW